MGSEKHIKIHNKSDKPDNVVLNEHDLVSDARIWKNSCRRFSGAFSPT